MDRADVCARCGHEGYHHDQDDGVSDSACGGSGWRTHRVAGVTSKYYVCDCGRFEAAVAQPRIYRRYCDRCRSTLFDTVGPGAKCARCGRETDALELVISPATHDHSALCEGSESAMCDCACHGV